MMKAITTSGGGRVGLIGFSSLELELGWSWRHWSCCCCFCLICYPHCCCCCCHCSKDIQCLKNSKIMVILR